MLGLGVLDALHLQIMIFGGNQHIHCIRSWNGLEVIENLFDRQILLDLLFFFCFLVLLFSVCVLR